MTLYRDDKPVMGGWFNSRRSAQRWAKEWVETGRGTLHARINGRPYRMRSGGTWLTNHG